jgi:acyl-CoA reductase-like NAD-dependent aldehyde dehydrogenase
MQMLIGGRWVDKPQTIPVKNPFNGEVIETVPRADLGDVDAAFASAVRGLEQMSELSAYERYGILHRVAQAVETRAEELAQTLALEVGKTIREARGEVSRTIQTFAFAAEEAKRIYGEGIPFDAAPRGENKLGFTLRVPVGIVVAITPFNFPLNLAAHKVAPALAAGNSVVLKPATNTPLTDLMMGRILREAGLPDQALNLITGYGHEIGDALTADERGRMITFTGSLEVGKRLMAHAGLKKATMELGSNSAVIVMEDADLEDAAARIVAGAFALAGQVCISVQRVYVQKSAFEALVRAVVDRAEKLKVGDPLKEDTDVGPMISLSAAQEAQVWIQEALDRGGELVCGGRREGSMITPAVLQNVAHDCRICSEEAFAPLVVINSVEDLDQAIDRVNDSKYGLQGGIFTRDLASALEAAKRIHVGGVMVNEVPTFRVDHMPYGGVKGSGLGREGLKYAVEEMTEIRLVCFRT